MKKDIISINQDDPRDAIKLTHNALRSELLQSMRDNIIYWTGVSDKYGRYEIARTKVIDTMPKIAIRKCVEYWNNEFYFRSFISPTDQILEYVRFIDSTYTQSMQSSFYCDFDMIYMNDPLPAYVAILKLDEGDDRNIYVKGHGHIDMRQGSLLILTAEHEWAVRTTSYAEYCKTIICRQQSSEGRRAVVKRIKA